MKDNIPQHDEEGSQSGRCPPIPRRAVLLIVQVDQGAPGLPLGQRWRHLGVVCWSATASTQTGQHFGKHPRPLRSLRRRNKQKQQGQGAVQKNNYTTHLCSGVGANQSAADGRVAVETFVCMRTIQPRNPTNLG